MASVAFHGTEAVRDEALARLRDHMDRKARLPGLLRRDGEKGTIAACLGGSASPDEWKAALGLSPWMAYALDTVAGYFDTPRGVAFAEALMGSVTPGAETALLAHGVVIAVLDRIAAREELDPMLEDVRCALRALHERAMAGEPVAGPEWRLMRRAALTASDAVPAQDGAGSVIEAAGWDAGRSQTTVAEVLRHWMHVETASAKLRTDWTKADDARAQELLSEMSRRFLEPNPAEKRDVFQLLEEHHPEFEGRLRAHTQFLNGCATASAEIAATLLVDTLRAAA